MYLAGIITTDGVVRGTRGKVTRLLKMVEPLPMSYTWARQKLDHPERCGNSAGESGAICGYSWMDRLHIESVDRVRLAGAFGSHIDVKYAMVLGLLPDCLLANVTSAGNAAGTGARIALLDYRARTRVESLVRRVEKVETAVEPKFQEHFVQAMAIPHKRLRM